MQALADALQLTRLPAVMECFDISNISTTHVVASMVCFRNGVPDKDNYRRYRIRTVEGQDDFASMAEVVRRRYSRVLLEVAEMETGSRESLARSGSASAEEFAQESRRKLPSADFQHSAIRNPKSGIRSRAFAGSDHRRWRQRTTLIGVPRTAALGLARIADHRSGERVRRDLPAGPRACRLQLPPDSGALRLLQRIRDEAHRFANTYHQLLMKKRIGESILDDCPGVSQNRKNLLLRKFGSVNRLRKATVEQIAATEGIGPKLAEDVHRFLQRH